MTRPPLLAAALVVTGCLFGAAGCITLYRYQITLVPTESCIIRPNGEFCDEMEQLPPPRVEVWSVKIEDEHTIVYIGSETWVADGIENQREVVKERSSLRNGCTTTVTATLSFNEDGQTFTGTFEQKTRVEGPESCGDAPFGDRQVYDVVGETGPVL